MPSIKKRGDSYRIMVSLGYGMDGKQIRKTTTHRPPADVTEGKAEKLATAFAYEFEKHCQGMTSLDENIRFKELYNWYFEQIAPHKLKENTIYNNRRILELYVLPYIGHLKLKDINTARIGRLFLLFGDSFLPFAKGKCGKTDINIAIFRGGYLLLILLMNTGKILRLNCRNPLSLVLRQAASGNEL